MKASKQRRALRWAVDRAAEWRGSLVGDPNPQPLAEFDAHVAEARAALRELTKKPRPVNTTRRSLTRRTRS